ncbi:hypothetical protein DPV78_004042 [Talaromyces pinophilus]|nr:hypothetical protein DPV78_004042 [Talaromyces pinophilus]
MNPWTFLPLLHSRPPPDQTSVFDCHRGDDESDSLQIKNLPYGSCFVVAVTVNARDFDYISIGTGRRFRSSSAIYVSVL